MKNCCTEYITLFNNPVKNYRKPLLGLLQKVRAIDKNVISHDERRNHMEMKSFKSCTDIPWPLV